MDFVHSFTWLLHGFTVKIAGIVGIMVLISMHEFGHFLFCKLFNVHTPSFSIGFGPKLLTKKIGDTNFSISAIPLGGYVEIAGMAEVGQGEQKEATRTDERSFAAKPFYQKMCILCGGIFFNFMFAYLVLIGLFLTGIPKTRFLYPFNASTTIALVEKDSPAEKIGLLSGDHIISVDGIDMHNKAHDLIRYLKKNAQKEVTLELERKGIHMTIACPLQTRTSMGVTGPWLGTDFEMQAQPGTSFVDAIKQGIYVSNAYIYTMFLIFKYIFTTFDVRSIGGPVSIISQTAQGAAQGFGILLIFLVLISINLAIINLLPLPILDGGQVLVYAFESVTGYKIPLRVREYMHYASWMLLMVFLLLITFKDVRELFRPRTKL